MVEYGLFLKVGRRYVRISSQKYPKATAVRVFQSPLLAYCGFGACLRPFKESDLYADIQLVPSYGRDYSTAEEVKADWESDKDFTIVGRTAQCNKSDHLRYGDGNVALVFFDSRSKVTRV